MKDDKILKEIDISKLVSGSDVGRLTRLLSDPTDIVNVICAGCERLLELRLTESQLNDLVALYRNADCGPANPFFAGCIEMSFEMAKRLKEFEDKCFPPLTGERAKGVHE